VLLFLVCHTNRNEGNGSVQHLQAEAQTMTPRRKVENRCDLPFQPFRHDHKDDSDGRAGGNQSTFQENSKRVFPEHDTQGREKQPQP